MGNRWGIVETMSDFIFLGSKITADVDCSQEIKRCEENLHLEIEAACNVFFPKHWTLRAGLPTRMKITYKYEV